jgi:hypothetical protein
MTMLTCKRRFQLVANRMPWPEESTRAATVKHNQIRGQG